MVMVSSVLICLVMCMVFSLVVIVEFMCVISMM